MPNLTQEQIALRKRYLGSSQWNAVLTGEGAYAAFAFAVHGISQEAGTRAGAGHSLEPIIAQQFVDVTGKRIQPCQKTYTHPTLPLSSTPDYYVGDDELLECKARWQGLDDWNGEEGTDEIPDAVLLQAQGQLALTGRKRCHVALLDVMAWKFRFYIVEADPELAAIVCERLADWWTRHVIGEVPPALDGSDLAMACLKARHPKNGGDVIETADDEGEIMRHVTGYLVESERSRQAAEVAELHKQNLCRLIGDHDGIRLPSGHLVTWKQPSGVAFKWKDIAADALALLPAEAQRAIADRHAGTHARRIHVAIPKLDRLKKAEAKKAEKTAKKEGKAA